VPWQSQTTITYAVRNWDVDTAKQEIAEFNKIYPNIKVEMITFDANLNEFLTARVAAGQPLPDVMTGWEGFPFLVHKVGSIHSMNLLQMMPIGSMFRQRSEMHSSTTERLTQFLGTYTSIV